MPAKIIIINTSNLKIGGALQVAESFVQEACKITDVQFFVILGVASSELIKPEMYKAYSQLNFVTVGIQPTHSVFNLFHYRRRLSKIEKQVQPDGVITIFGPCFWKPRSRHIMGFANGYLLYEDTYFFSIWKDWKTLRYKLIKLIRRSLLRSEANYYWTETEESKARLAAFLKKPQNKIIAISNNCSNYFRCGNYMVFENLPTKKSIRLLYVSSYYPHKGFELIPPILAKLQETGIGVEMIVTIAEEEYKRIFSGCNNVINLGTIDPKYCPYLYLQSDIVFAPTLLEIFSAVYPEAMYMQKPIITTDLPFARNICGNAALYFNPELVEDAVEKIQQLIFDSNLRQQLIANGLERLKSFDLPEDRFRKILNRLLENVSTD